MPSFYPEGNLVLASDDSNRTLHKLAGLLGGGTSSGGSGIGTQQVYIDYAPLPPAVLSLTAINTRSDGGSWSTWSPAAQAWI